MCICNICIHKCASHIHNRYPMPFSKLLWEVAPNAAPAPALRPHRGTPWRCGESILSKHIWIIDYHHQKNRCSMELHQNRLPVWKDMKIDVWRLIFLFAHTSSGSLYIWICMRFVLAIRVSPGNATESSGLVKATMPMWSQSGFRFVGGISSEHIQTISSERTKPYIYIIYIYMVFCIYIYIVYTYIYIYILVYIIYVLLFLSISWSDFGQLSMFPLWKPSLSHLPRFFSHQLEGMCHGGFPLSLVDTGKSEPKTDDDWGYPHDLGNLHLIQLPLYKIKLICMCIDIYIYIHIYMESGMLWGGIFAMSFVCVCFDILIYIYIYIYIIIYIYKYLISSKLFLFNICTREPGWKDCQSVNLMFSLFIEKYDKPMFFLKKKTYLFSWVFKPSRNYKTHLSSKACFPRNQCKWVLLSQGQNSLIDWVGCISQANWITVCPISCGIL